MFALTYPSSELKEVSLVTKEKLFPTFDLRYTWSKTLGYVTDMIELVIFLLSIIS